MRDCNCNDETVKEEAGVMCLQPVLVQVQYSSEPVRLSVRLIDLGYITATRLGLLQPILKASCL